jgi:hypothetical protein
VGAVSAIFPSCMGRTKEINTGSDIKTYTRLHDKPGRVIWLTRLDHPLQAVRPPCPEESNFLRRRCTSPRSEEEVREMDIDPERTTGLDVIQIGMMNVPVEESGKRPVVTNNQVVTPTQKGSVANDHEASGSKSRTECFLPRWCPPRLTHTQRRKLQRLKLREKREKELEKRGTKISIATGLWCRRRRSGDSRQQPRQGRSNRRRGRLNRLGRLDRVTRRSDRALQKCRPVSLLRSPWLVMTRFRLSILQRTTNSLWTTVLLQSG